MDKKNFKFEENIKNLSSSNDMNHIINEWNFLRKEENIINRCICNHILKRNVYYYYNDKTYHFIAVGGECKKFFKKIDKNINNFNRLVDILLKGNNIYIKIDNLIDYSINNILHLIKEIKNKLEKVININEFKK